MSYSSNNVDTQVRWSGEEPTWRFTGIYGWPEHYNKLRTCVVLEELCSHSDLLWLVGGTLMRFSTMGTSSEALSNRRRLLGEFRDTFDECGLYDLGFSGYDYTWWNGQKGERSVEERLDRFYAFRFLFENMWALNDSYEECMSSIWASVGGLNAVGSLFKNATACGMALSKWNEEKFDNIQSRIRDLELRLKFATNAEAWRDILNEAEHIQCGVANEGGLRGCYSGGFYRF
ncbi:hypothetical protein Cgig2_012220 [Carnegiea gigantea]|uniref:Uncharacterized protein n=1 Tax=Carnegiea gigantea TaxID=171969 RepID=A0A9Q1QP35_9CARY|nr:hypothetical protein Cgig2_012220 [Carnegiea gigantea]